jgi:hypothetical protein
MTVLPGAGPTRTVTVLTGPGPARTEMTTEGDR